MEYNGSIADTENVSKFLEKALTALDYSSVRGSDFLVPMRDGVKILTHTWFPKGEGPWPVLLQRTPYVDGPSTFEKSPMKLYTLFGYAVIVQECRGCGASEGCWEPYTSERNDGLDTLDWLVAQPWMNGHIGLVGGSYTTSVQWLIADRLPPEVKTMMLSIAGTDQYRFTHMNGMFKLGLYTKWGVKHGYKPSEIDPAVFKDPQLSDKAYRYRPHMEMDKELLGTTMRWYRDYISNPAPGSAFWNDGLWGDMKTRASEVNVPVFMTVGWHDIALETMCLAYEQLRPDIRKRSRFMIGPWGHSMAPEGDMTYPNDLSGFFRLAEGLQWLDHTMKGNRCLLPTGKVDTYVIGANGWTSWEEWPPHSVSSAYYLQGDQQLSTSAGVDEKSVSFTYDPDNPVPTCGGGTSFSFAGSRRQAEAGERDDVVTLFSPRLEEDIPIVGTIQVSLYVSSTAEDTAFTVKVSELFPDGSAFNIADGISTLEFRNGAREAVPYRPNEVVNVTFELWPITWTIRSGSKIRLDISSSNFPAYHVHPNISGLWAEQTATKRAVQTLYWGGRYPACITFPVAP